LNDHGWGKFGSNHGCIPGAIGLVLDKPFVPLGR
jgi:hypothetical protein